MTYSIWNCVTPPGDALQCWAEDAIVFLDQEYPRVSLQPIIVRHLGCPEKPAQAATSKLTEGRHAMCPFTLKGPTTVASFDTYGRLAVTPLPDNATCVYCKVFRFCSELRCVHVVTNVNSML